MQVLFKRWCEVLQLSSLGKFSYCFLSWGKSHCQNLFEKHLFSRQPYKCILFVVLNAWGSGQWRIFHIHVSVLKADQSTYQNNKKKDDLSLISMFNGVRTWRMIFRICNMRFTWWDVSILWDEPTRRGNLIEIPLLGSTSPIAAGYNGDKLRSAALTSHTNLVSNQTSGTNFSAILQSENSFSPFSHSNSRKSVQILEVRFDVLAILQSTMTQFMSSTYIQKLNSQ